MPCQGWMEHFPLFFALHIFTFCASWIVLLGRRQEKWIVYVHVRCVYAYINISSPSRLVGLECCLRCLLLSRWNVVLLILSFFFKLILWVKSSFFFFFLSRIVVLLRMHSKGNVKPFLSVSVFVIIYVVSSLYHTNAQWNKRRRARGFGREEKRREDNRRKEKRETCNLVGSDSFSLFVRLEAS